MSATYFVFKGKAAAWGRVTMLFQLAGSTKMEKNKITINPIPKSQKQNTFVLFVDSQRRGRKLFPTFRVFKSTDSSKWQKRYHFLISSVNHSDTQTLGSASSPRILQHTNCRGRGFKPPIPWFTLSHRHIISNLHHLWVTFHAVLEDPGFLNTRDGTVCTRSERGAVPRTADIVDKVIHAEQSWRDTRHNS